jgi:hypothetical protein
MMREYRAQLDAERARKLSQGRNHSSSKSKHSKGMCSNLVKVHKPVVFFCHLFPYPVSNDMCCIFNYTDKKDKISKKHSSKKRKVCLISNIYFFLEKNQKISFKKQYCCNYLFNYYTTMSCWVTFLLVFSSHAIGLVLV